ncbi:MAG TPA: PhnD/SsuA/transferrin family substrate-binding protein, partial [Verrucomicrobiae bacterium]|nr:PhnD/SsuA/transferrin family substrate-binding protein [Verrucomicrobiae bacterium]
MAENSELVCRLVAAYLAVRLDLSVEYISEIPWQERESRFDRGEIEILWLCGLPYADKIDSLRANMELLAVPVPAGERYQDLPIYFSDVVVRRDSRFESFAHLRATAWAFNEPRSHSGYNVVRAHLAEIGLRHGFFGETVESGAHSLSVEMILTGRVDGAAIDSTVLEWLLSQRPELARQISVIETIGPSPIPPWVISKEVPEKRRRALRTLLLDMHQDAFGRDILDRGWLRR